MTEQTQQPQQETISLFDGIDTVLREGGVENADAWKRFLPGNFLDINDAKYQRWLINEAWRRVLGPAQTTGICNTMDARFCLTDSGTDKDWMGMFRQVILPCVRDHQLLQKLS